SFVSGHATSCTSYGSNRAHAAFTAATSRLGFCPRMSSRLVLLVSSGTNAGSGLELGNESRSSVVVALGVVVPVTAILMYLEPALGSLIASTALRAGVVGVAAFVSRSQISTGLLSSTSRFTRMSNVLGTGS